MQTLRFAFALIAGLRAVLVYGEASSMTSEPWALRMTQRVLATLSWRPRPASQPVGEPVHSG